MGLEILQFLLQQGLWQKIRVGNCCHCHLNRIGVHLEGMRPPCSTEKERSEAEGVLKSIENRDPKRLCSKH